MEIIKKILSNNLNVLILLDIFLLIFSLIVYFFEIDISDTLYDFLKWILIFTFGFLSYDLFKKKPNNKLILAFLIMFIIFNPFKPLDFEQEVWIGIDIFTLLLLFIYFCMINSIPLINIIKNLFFKFLKEFLIVIDVYDVQNKQDEDCNSFILKRLKIDKIKRILFTFFLLTCFVFIIIFYRNISEIKKSAYICLIHEYNTCYEQELKSLSKFGLNYSKVKKQLENKYDKEIKSILENIAYNYKHNKKEFYNLKKKYLLEIFDNDISIFNKKIDKILGFKVLPLPKSGVLHNYTGKVPVAPFEIKIRDDRAELKRFTTHSIPEFNPIDWDCRYIKLIDIKTEKTKVIIFIRDGEKTIKTLIPLGQYKLKMSYGTNWYGEKNLFGVGTSYSYSNQILSFYASNDTIYGHRITLYSDTDGNFFDKEMQPEDF